MQDREAVVKKLESYRNAFFAFFVLVYVVGRAGEMIKETGGASPSVAFFYRCHGSDLSVYCYLLRRHVVKIKKEAQTIV